MAINCAVGGKCVADFIGMPRISWSSNILARHGDCKIWSQLVTTADMATKWYSERRYGLATAKHVENQDGFPADNML
jgi:hypothetical protein